MQAIKEIKVTEVIQESQDCQAHKVPKVMMDFQEDKDQRVTVEYQGSKEREEAQDHKHNSLKVRFVFKREHNCYTCTLYACAH